MKSKTIHGNEGPYLTIHRLAKFKLFGVIYSICIHQFHRGDEDPDCHDHPFDFWTFILWGGYREYAPAGNYHIRKPFTLLYREAKHKHRVELLGKSCWTLCIKIGEGDREWGFWRDDEFVPWRDYLIQKGMTPQSKHEEVL